MATAPVTPQSIFVPNAYPPLTYVGRERDFELELRNALQRLGSVVSLTGRSKSGKTVLARRVIGVQNACTVNSSLAGSVGAFWGEVLRQLGAADSQEWENSSAQEQATETGLQATGNALIASAAVSRLDEQRTSSNTTYRSSKKLGTGEAIDLLRQSGKTLLLDDFHYLARDLRRDIGRQLKDAAYGGVPIIILSVPQHDDDAVQAVPDLRGRIYSIELPPWSEVELCRIPAKGFPQLNVSLSDSAASQLARECIGSPQLMQQLCLETCMEKRLIGRLETLASVDLSQTDFASILQRASRTATFTTLYRKLEQGPPQHGSNRTLYRLNDGSEGDNYRVVLAALAADPATTSVPYADLRRRVEAVCVAGAHPTMQTIVQTIGQMSRIAKEHGGAGSGASDPALEWLPDRSELVFPDTYFLFYLRWAMFPRHPDDRAP